MKAWLGVLTVASVATLFSPVARAANDDWTTYRLHGCSDFTVDAPADIERLATLKDSDLLLSLGKFYPAGGVLTCSVFIKPYPATLPYPVYSERFQAADPVQFCYAGGSDAKDVTVLDRAKFKADGLPAAHCATGYTDPADKERSGHVASLTTIIHPLCLYYLTCSVDDVDQESAQAEWAFDGIGNLVKDMESRMHVSSP